MTDETPAPLMVAEEAVHKALLMVMQREPRAFAATQFIRWLEQDGYTVAARSVPDDRLREAKGPVVGWRWADALSALHRHGIAYETLPEGIRSALAAAAALSASPTETPE